MSTFAEYTKKKKKEEEEAKRKTQQRRSEALGISSMMKTAPTTKGTSFKEYTGSVLGVDFDDDIAPVKSTVSDEKEEKKEKDSWFTSGAMDDGVSLKNIGKTILGTVGDAVEDIGAGILGLGEKALDAMLTIAPYAAQSQYYNDGGVYQPLEVQKINQERFDEAKKGNAEIIAKDLYDEEKIAKAIISNPIKNTTGFDIEEASVFGVKADSLAQSGGQLLATAGLQAVGVPWFLTTGASAFGSEAENALNQGATLEEAGLSATISAGAEILTEKLSGGIKFGGKTLDDALTKKLATSISNKVVRNGLKIGMDVVGEGSEEVVSSVFSRLGSALYKEEDIDELLTSEEAIDEYIDSFIGGAILGGVASTGRNIKSGLNGVDEVTGLNQSEQKVFDKVYNDAIAKAEADGKKLTQREKTKLYDATMNALEKGYIDTDTIESVLGGETYNSYKSLTEQESALKKEIETLENLPREQITVKQGERLTEIREQLKALDLDTPKSKLGSEVSDLVKGSRLFESYNEKTRRGQTFEADLTQYDAKQQEVVKKAVESGILNNSNRTHDFVDMIAKVSADKGVSFDFTNNQRLKESGFAIDGKTVNGFVQNGNVTLNIDSQKSLNSLVGHEITHVLEGTDLYTELQDAVKQYAMTKHEYNPRYIELSKTYKGVENANIDAEVTADLIGDYLFTDSDFISRLSAEKPNIFKRIYEEIKYLYNVATAGSKEARELEKVKRAFEKAYRESSTADAYDDSDIKFSIRKEAPPKNTGVAYKVFYVKDGKLYPPMVANPDGEATPVGVWLNADVGESAAPSKTGRAQVKAGGKGTQGGSGSLAFRPGWHLGDLPRASQFDRVNPENGKKELFPENFVWAEVEYAKDADYQDEAMSYGYTDNGKFRHAYAGLPKIPENGYYKYRTNPKPDTVPWIITGAMKVNRILSDAEVNAILEENGVSPVHRQGGDVDLEKFGFNNDGSVKYSVSDDYTISNNGKVAKLTDERIERLFDEFGASNPEYAQAYISSIHPRDFLSLTLKDESFAKWNKAAQEGTDEELYPLDVEKLRKQRQTPFLIVDTETGEVTGHEGRHRMRALLEAGVTDVPIAVIDYTTKYSKKSEASMRLTAQESYDGPVNNNFSTEIKNLIPINAVNRDAILSAYGGDGDIKYSISDSTGRQLTKGQQDYFKDSKVRDENGNLKVMYHGSPASFTQFDKKKAKSSGYYGSGFYFSESESHAGQYGSKYEVYLNIKNPMQSGTSEISKEQLRKFVEAVADNEDYGIENYGYGATVDSVTDSVYGKDDFAMVMDINATCVGDMAEAIQLFNEVNGTDYDGIIVPTEIVAFYPEQIKNVSNTDPTPDPDIRFSLSDTVEETKDLIAVHNLSGEKLMKSLRLGGLPMPSVAITRATDGHEGFGDISLIFDKNAIDPRASRSNKVYSGDAWTPTYPIVEYKANDTVRRTLEAKIRSLVPYEVQDGLGNIMLDSDNVRDTLNRYNGDMVDAFKGNDSMKYAYLLDNGVDIKLPMKEADLYHYGEVSNEAVRYFAGKLVNGLQTVEHYQNMSGRDTLQDKELTEAVADALNFAVLRTLEPDSAEYLEYEQNPVFRADEVGLRDIDGFLSAARKLLKNGVQQTVDRKAARELIRDTVDQSAYESWLKEQFSGIVEKEGIRNNKDLFTPSGNRRSFEALHYENNLENVIKAMRDKGEKGIGALGSNIFGASTVEYGSIDEIKEAGKKLQTMTHEEWVDSKQEFQQRFTELASSLPNAKDSYSAMDSASEVLVEAVSKYKTRDGIARYLKKELSGWAKYSEQVVDDLIALVNDIRNMPVNYFEAKPQRAVGFDEVGVFVIPYDADAKLKQELLNRGYSIAEYDPNVEGDRKRVVNQFEQYKFSLSDAGQNPRQYGNYNVYGRDIALEQDIAPVKEIDRFAPDYAPLTEEQANERDTAKEDGNYFLDATDDWEEAFYNGSYANHTKPADPFAEKDIWEDGKDRKVKAYMYENPEVKPFFQQEAQYMMGELNNSTKGERFYNDQLYYDTNGEMGFFGTKRHTSEEIAYLLDTFNYTYKDIAKGLNAIIEDNGKENNAISKRIEFLLDERLRLGYTDFWFGDKIPPNQEYINLLNSKQITEYNDESWNNWLGGLSEEDIKTHFSAKDNIAPPEEYIAAESDIAPVRETVEPEAPLYENATGQKTMFEEPKKPQTLTRSVLHKNIIKGIKDKFVENSLNLDDVLKDAKNLSTFATVDNTPQRVMEKALGYKAGQVLSDVTVNKVAQNETDGIKWLNSFTDRQNGLLRRISKQYHIKPGSKESAAAQMYAEGFYVNDNNEIISYGDAELAKDFPNREVQANIRGLAKDERIRQIYDETLRMINESRARNAYPEIPRLDNYFLHFRAMEDTFSRLGLPFNPNDIRAKDLPTDLNGVTADLKPGQPYFASAMHRTGKRTSFDLLGGLERYLTSAKNQIYHIDDIQTLRALRNYIADTYGQANGIEGLDALSEEEAQERIEKVYSAHLSTFAKFLNEEANVLAGKTTLIDRGVEGSIGRRGLTFLDTLRKQTGSNMVGFNISSSLTNFLPVAQTFAKSNKADFVKAFAQTASNKINSIFGRSDGFAEQSPVMIRRRGADRFNRTWWQKRQDEGYLLMGAVDSISTELIARTKHNELIRKGMDEQKAHYETDKWVSRLMGDRSIGQMPHLYNSKTLGLITQFQLEVRNQLDSQFYDTIQEAKVSSEDIQNGLARNAVTAAKVASTFVQLAVVQHLFGKAFESVAGYNPAFDIIEVLLTACGYDDEEDSEDTMQDNLHQAFLALLEDLPYTSTITGGRIPISSALPAKELVTGEDQYGNEKPFKETLKEIAPYYVLPTGYGQIKKTAQGLSMFDDDLPIAGSYTDSGNLRFPIDDTPENRIKAGLFGQWASENARDYFDNERTPLKEKQIQEFIDVDIPIRDYWEYREGLSGLENLSEKADYINSLDLPIDKKNILINNLTDRKEEIDLTGFDEDYADFEEFDFAVNNPEKYEIAQKVGGYKAYVSYKEGMKGLTKLEEKADYIASLDLTTEQKNALINGETDRKEPIDLTGYENYGSFEEFEYAKEKPGKHAVVKASCGYEEYVKHKDVINDIRADKDSNGNPISGSAKAKKKDYIFSLDLDYGQKALLYRMYFDSAEDKAEYNADIVRYLDSRYDVSYEEMVTILDELGMKMHPDGRVTW